MMSPAALPGTVAVQAPASLLWAVRLMFVGAGFSLLGGILSLAQSDSARSEIIRTQPAMTSSAVDAAMVAFTIGAIITALLSVGLWILNALMNRRGKGWARIMSSVLAGLNFVFFLIGIGQSATLGVRLVNVVLFLLGLSIAALLWLPASSRFYADSKAPKYT